MTREQIERNIATYEEVIKHLKEKLKTAEDSAFDESLYWGKFFIQNMYEKGTRYMYVDGAEEVGGDLSFYASGILYDNNLDSIEYISANDPKWIDNIQYGTLREVSREDFIEEILNLLRRKLNTNY